MFQLYIVLSEIKSDMLGMIALEQQEITNTSTLSYESIVIASSIVLLSILLPTCKCAWAWMKQVWTW